MLVLEGKSGVVEWICCLFVKKAHKWYNVHDNNPPSNLYLWIRLVACLGGFLFGPPVPVGTDVDCPMNSRPPIQVGA